MRDLAAMPRPRLLVVDDEEHVRFALVRWFEACGFDVDVAFDGQDAVTKCAENEYDVITMDLVMPRMDGATAVRAIRELSPTVPIVVLSGYPERLVPLSGPGPTRTFAKPMMLRDLEREIRALLDPPATVKA